MTEEPLKQVGTAVGFPEPSDREKLGKLLELKRKLVSLSRVDLETYSNLISVEKAVRLRIERQEKTNA